MISADRKTFGMSDLALTEPAYHRGRSIRIYYFRMMISQRGVVFRSGNGYLQNNLDLIFTAQI
jgi:hypothetical protein